MIAMNLAQVADAIGLPVEAGWADVCVLSVEFDTRRVTPGALFVALHGEHTDGHAFAGAAAQAGAVAVLGSAPIEANLPLLRVTDDPDNTAVLAALGDLARASVTALIREHGLEVVGVTGSSGKTSTKDLIAAVLSSAVDDPGRVIAPPESFNNELGHPYTALRATPLPRVAMDLAPSKKNPWASYRIYICIPVSGREVRDLKLKSMLAEQLI